MNQERILKLAGVVGELKDGKEEGCFDMSSYRHCLQRLAVFFALSQVNRCSAMAKRYMRFSMYAKAGVAEIQTPFPPPSPGADAG